MNKEHDIISPDGVRHLRFPLPRVADAQSIDAAVRHALGAFDSPRWLTVLVNDPQRHTGTGAVLAEIARHVDPAGIRVLVACGSHTFGREARAVFESALGESLGGGAVEAVAWHDCRSGQLACLGDAWMCHRWLLESRPLLAIGSVEPHYFAGFTGAHKTATIGVAAYRDIESNHAHALGDECRPCRLAGNPVYEGVANMLWTLMAYRPLAAVNLVQAGTRVVAAYGGEPFATLTAAAAVAEQAFARRAEEPVDALVAEVSRPLGRSFYQADKGIKNSEHAVRDGGCIVLSAPCDDGIGQADFVDLLTQAATHRQAANIVAARGYRLGDHKAVRLRRLTDPAARGVKVFLVSPGISEAQAKVLGLAKAPDVASALRRAGVDPRRDRVYAIEDAGNHCLLPKNP
jgi:nickel-dependent lactate racemase